MDPLTDPKPVARKPQPKFGYVPTADPEPEIVAPGPELDLLAKVLYIGPEKQDVFKGMMDTGMIIDGPQTAAQLGIGADPNGMFWEVMWSNRIKKRQCWTPASSLRPIP